MAQWLVRDSLVCLGCLALFSVACAPAAPATVEIPKRRAPPRTASTDALPARKKLAGPTLAMRAIPPPSGSVFLPDGRLLSWTGAEGYVAHPRATSPWLDLRRVPLEGAVRVSPNGKRYFRTGRSVVAEIDPATLADTHVLRVPGTIFTVVSSRDGSRLVVTALDDLSGPTKIVVVDTSTFQPVRTWELPGLGAAGFSDNERYVVASVNGTRVLDVASGKELFLAADYVHVVGDFVVTPRDGIIRLEHLGTHKNVGLRLPCKGIPTMGHGYAAIHCGSKLAIVRLAPNEAPKIVDVGERIKSVEIDLERDGFRLELPSGSAFVAIGDMEVVPVSASECQGRDGTGRVVGEGQRFCQAQVSPDGRWLTYGGGLNLAHASNGQPTLNIAWPRGPSDPFVMVAKNQFVVWPDPAIGREALSVPFESARGAATYVARSVMAGSDIFELATKKKVATLPVDIRSAEVEGTGDDVVVASDSGIVRCSLSKATCLPLDDVPCPPIAFSEGRGLCETRGRQGSTLTRFTVGKPSQTRILTFPYPVEGAYVGKAGWVLKTRRLEGTEAVDVITHLADKSFTADALVWTKVSGRVRGVEGDIAVIERNFSAFDLVDMVTRETSVLVLQSRGAVKIHPDGYVAFFGDRTEAEQELLCFQGDRVTPWSACRDREIPW